MKFLLPFILILFHTTVVAEDYLKLRSYPSYPAPGEAISQTVKMQFSPSFPEDKQFEKLNNLLTKISSIKDHNLIVLHVAYISLELNLNGKVIETIYSKNTVNNNTELKENWEEVFKILQVMSNQQLQP